ncbi:proline racemase family protein [Cohnella cholangitidis]|uniref:Proline racemase n=1 Tax=Cohnella cholangitidis TaxID=2598458 RepID=A0A7G5C399_9BACL|nr:proline racemase family protein [Cohnella cholangitidis]QMV43683.1 hypothetical protein FPL14_22790 [Cohnella cholangitidis]
MRLSHMIHTIDVHVAGWPLRVLQCPIPEGKNEQSLRQAARKLWDDDHSILHWLQREPRGHAAMRVAVVDTSDAADVRMLVFDSEGYCRTDSLDALCVATGLAEIGAGTFDAFRSPGQIHRTTFTPHDSTVDEARIEGDAAECVAIDEEIELGDLNFTVDRADCGHRYVIVDAKRAGLDLSVANKSKLEKLAARIGQATKGNWEERGDGQSNVPRLAENNCRIAFMEASSGQESAWRAVTCYEDGRLFRAPEAGSIGAMLAVMNKRNRVTVGGNFLFQGLSGSSLHSNVTGLLDQEGRPALFWELRGRAFVTGSHQFLVHPDDPLSRGFLLR